METCAETHGNQGTGAGPEITTLSKNWRDLMSWQQATIKELGTTIRQFSHTSHIFGANYQHNVESDLVENLPLTNCVAVIDFSENYALQSHKTKLNPPTGHRGR